MEVILQNKNLNTIVLKCRINFDIASFYSKVYWYNLQYEIEIFVFENFEKYGFTKFVGKFKL